MKQFPRLFARDTKQRIKVWDLEVHGSSFISHAGLLDGVKTPATTLCFAKQNTTAEEQALKEAEAKWKKQFQKDYRPSIEESDVAPKRPNLCQDYKDMGHNMIFPCLIGPKLNGMRVTLVKNPATKLYEGHSRYLKPVRVPEQVQNALALMNLPDVLDGELYIHGWHLQDILSLIKRAFEYVNGKSGKKSDVIRKDYHKLEFHVFAFPDPTKNLYQMQLPFADPQTLMAACSPQVQAVPSKICQSHEQHLEMRADYESRGFEGVVMRAWEGTYDYGSKTRSMMKSKSFMGIECKCVGLDFDKDGLAIAVLITKENHKFNATIEGKNGYESNTSYRTAIVADPSLIVGKQCTLRFFEYTKDMIPFHATLEAVRDYE